MGFLGWLFGSKRSLPTRQPVVARRQRKGSIVLDGEWLQYDATGLFGQFRYSPNRKFILAWSDADPSGMRGGARNKGAGRFLLVQDGQRIITQGRVPRPNDGKVADNGTFIFNDWGFDTSALKGTFCAFSATGEPLVKKKFNANLYNNGLSPDGRFAACQTCNAGAPDGNVLAVFDLDARTEICRFTPKTGWAKSYEFASDGKTLSLVYEKLGPIAYSLAGELLDESSWEAAVLAKGDLVNVAMLIGDALKQEEPDLPVERAVRFLAALERISPQVKEAPSWGPVVLKLRGACFEAKGEAVQALKCYESAMTENPKIGVKRRADKLKKRLANPAAK